MDALDDRADCEELIHYLIDAIDEGEWERAAAYLTDDFEYSQRTAGALVPAVEVTGKQAWLDLVGGIELNAKTSQHYIANVAMRMQGDEARALARDIVAHVFTADGATEVVYTGSRLELHFRRTPEGWRVSRLVGAPTWKDPRFPGLLDGSLKPGQ